MESRISKWGNSFGVRIPRTLAHEAGIQENTTVEITLEGDRIVICKVTSYKLDELLSKVTSDNMHSESDTGQPQGQEAW